MSRAGSATRARVVQSAKERMRRHGVAATSMLDSIADAGASRGSLYHYFPGGKTQLIEEATATAVDEYTAAFAAAEGLDAEQALPLVLLFWSDVIEGSGFEAGCPVVAAALGGADVASARELAGAAFAGWTTILEGVLERSGVPAVRVPGMATMALAAIEGAVVLGLAQHSIEPMEQVVAELRELVRSAAG